MNHHDLEFFVQIAKSGNLSRAAKALYVSPSALSQYLSRLEKDLQTPLFLRVRGYSLELTGEGRLYYNFCAETLARWQSTMRSIEELKNQRPEQPAELQSAAADQSAVQTETGEENGFSG